VIAVSRFAPDRAGPHLEEGDMLHDVRMDDLIEANPNLEQQMRDWQTERHHRGENPFDWQAFRAVMSYVGACDPGERPPSEFFWFTPPGSASPLVPDLTIDSSDVPSARLVSPGRDVSPSGSADARHAELTEVKYWR
jgi:hypothetical protein